MNKAEIHIQDPAGKTLYRKEHSAPSSWEEMTKEDLLLYGSTMATTIDYHHALIVLAGHLYKIPTNIFQAVPRSEASRLALSVGFLFRKNTLHIWLINAIWNGCFKYYGPKSALSNVTMAEFALCEICYEQYQNTRKKEYLYTLVAILYRPARFFGIKDDIRVELTDHGYIKRAKKFKKLPLRTVLAVYLNYEGCRNTLHKRYPEVFTPGSGKPSLAEITLTPWNKIIESSANDIFGPLDKTEKANLHKFLSRKSTVMKQQRDLEKQSNRA